VRVAVVGLRFGAAFVPIYQDHPDVTEVAACDQLPDRLSAVGDKHGVRHRFSSLDELLSADGWDAVHLVTPVHLHVEQAIAALRSGRHVASAVPAGTSLDGLRRLVAAQRESGKSYMMMETAVYTREFLYVKDLHKRGLIGRIQFLRGAHLQDMEGWPPYWAGLPPMHYATHALGPLLHLTGARAVSVTCHGSGHMRPELRAQYGNPYPIETATFRLEGEHAAGIAAEVTRSLFETAVTSRESFDVYGDRATFLWHQVPGDQHAVIAFGEPEPGAPRRPVAVERPEIPYRPDLLPPSLAPFASGGHGGSHPHLVHEFVRSIVERRSPSVDVTRAANWTAAGLCAHESAMQGGAPVAIPSFD
jgi:predicted dehydrogenase